MNHTQFLKTLLTIAAVLSLLSVGAWGSTYKVIYNFTGGTDGSRPADAGNLAIDSNGNLYGTTEFGGACGLGTLFALSPNGSGGWTEIVLHSFCGQDGAVPTAAPILSAPSPVELSGTTVYGFTGDNGEWFIWRAFPSPGIVQRGIGQGLKHLYASPALFYDASLQATDEVFTAFDGGPNGYGGIDDFIGDYPYGFCSLPGCADGAHPASALAADSSGNMYGTTNSGGSNNQGTVYEWLSDNSRYDQEVVLHSFAGGTNDGAYPFFADLTLQTTCSVGFCSQTIWGTTPMGGAGAARGGTGYGTVFAINQLSGFSLVHSFSLFDGVYPFAGLTNLNGTFYGTTSQAGLASGGRRIKLGKGTVYSLTSSGTLTVLHTFTGPDGAQPFSGLVADSSGNLYGVTYVGGVYGAGVVYEITP